MPGTFTVTGMSAGENAGERIFGPLTIQGKRVIGETLVVNLVEGDNTFEVPTEAVAVMIIPEPNSSALVKLRTNLNASDAGLPLNPSPPLPFVYPFEELNPTSLILHAAASVSGMSIVFI